jgi:hypothetical protein
MAAPIRRHDEGNASSDQAAIFCAWLAGMIIACILFRPCTQKAPVGG